MASNQVLCCFKNFTSCPGALELLARNPNGIFNGIDHDQFKHVVKSEDKVEISCSRKQVERIRSYWTKQLPAKYRSIWFMYQPLFDLKSIKSKKHNYNGDMPVSWLVGCDAGTMISSDLFQCYSSSKFLYRLDIEKDDDGRAVMIVLNDEEYRIQLRIPFDLIQHDILLNFQNINGSQSSSIILML